MFAGRIGRVDDAALAVAAFAGEVEAQFRALVAGEGHALLDQPFDGFAPVLHDVAGGRLVAQAGAGHQGVGDVLVVAVARIEHGGDAALRPVAGAVEELAFRNDRNPLGLREVQGHRQAGQTAADNSDVKFHGKCHICTEASL